MITTGRRQAFAAPRDLQTRVLRRLRALQTRVRYQLGIANLDPGSVRLSAAFHHPVDATRRSLVTSRYRELFGDAVSSELVAAQRLAAHQFRFLGHTMDYGARVSWSEDPVSGSDWPSDFSADIPYRGARRLGDIKIPWELNKHQYFFTLGKASWLADDPRLASEIVRQIDSWIEDNPCYQGINWISALEVGARAISWIMAYPFYAGACDDSVRGSMIRSLAQHMLFVERHLSIGGFANTHLTGEATALVAGGLFLDCRHSQRWLEKGLALLEEGIHQQVTEDGVHAERSVAYHRFFLDHYFLVSGLLASNGRSFSLRTREGMERMSQFLMDTMYPDGSVPAFNDGDDARGLWLRADASRDYHSVLALAAVLFGRADFKAAAGGLTEEVLWLFGDEGVSKFQTLAEQPPDHTSVAYPEAGYYVLRGGWSESDPVLVFDCGPLGHGAAGHGHADALSFELHDAGYAFIVDPGTFSYNLDYRWRDAFRSTRAHNTIVIDGVDQSQPNDRMSWKSMASSRCNQWLTTKWFDLVDGEHDGYRRLPDPITHRRVIVFVKPDTWWIWDECRGDGRHCAELLFHLTPDCTVEADRKTGRVILRSPEDASLHVWMPEGRDGTRSRGILEGTDEERAAWFSPGYGSRLPAQALSVRQEFVEKAVMVTGLSTSAAMLPSIVQEEGFFGVSMRRKGGVEEGFRYGVREGQLAKVHGVGFDGRILYYRAKDEHVNTVYASGFRNLSVTGVINVRSRIPVESLILEGNRCDLAVAAGDEDDLVIESRKGLEFSMRRRSIQPGLLPLQAEAVTS